MAISHQLQILWSVGDKGDLGDNVRPQFKIGDLTVYNMKGIIKP